MSHHATTDCVQTLVKVTGIVQGVGFRPYVYRHAIELGLLGSVLNNQHGVTIELQGRAAVIEQFIDTLRSTPPPLARIDTINSAPMTVSPHQSFVIIDSEASGDAVVAVSADKSTCADCIAEINDPHNRHYQYPFTNCTNCGPRYTLINALPYDRKHTSMASFTMCDDCASAYTDPLNRRYHAQPVSCPQCGPQIRLCHANGNTITHGQQALLNIVERINAGQIVAIKGLGGFHLVCDATNDEAVQTLRQRKQRPAKPLAIMVANVEMAKRWVQGNDSEWRLLQSKERPIVLMQKCQTLTNDVAINGPVPLSKHVAPAIDKLGIFLPYTPLHDLLLGELTCPIVATSANRSGEPIITDCEDVSQYLGDVVDAILDHNRPIINGCDDSVVQVVDNKLQVMRMARGYAPLSLHCDTPLATRVLAVGAQQKNSIAFGFENNLFLSPHIGDLFSIEAETYFDRTLDTFKRLYNFSPEAIARDPHPDYAPSRWTQSYCEHHPQTDSVTVQHHYAHILSVMAVNQCHRQVLGFAFDGTGLGDDGTLWGGEALLASPSGYERIGHLQPFMLIGGEQAIKDPRRILLALLFEQFTLEQVLALPIAPLNTMSNMLISNLHKLWQNGSSCIKTSSVGRLFDGVACALGLIETTQFEGQAGMLIEAAANRVNPNEGNPIAFILPYADGVWDTQALMAQVVTAVCRETLTESRVNRIAAAFLRSLANAVGVVASAYPHLEVVLSGGVFQNRALSELCLQQLKQRSIEVLPPQQIPINDGGIALGQLWYAVHQDLTNN